MIFQNIIEPYALCHWRPMIMNIKWNEIGITNMEEFEGLLAEKCQNKLILNDLGKKRAKQRQNKI